MGSTIDHMLESRDDAEDARLSLEARLADFFETHYARLTRLATLVCHAHVPVEDAVQAAMEQAWRRRHTLQDPARLRPWLDRIVVREAIRLNRRPWWGERGHPTDAEAAAHSDPWSAADPAWIDVVEAFRSLPIEQRAAIALHLYAGHSVEETAAIMETGLETTRSRLRLARQRLRRELREEDDR
ncbi:MAG: RNA polymerase sigma factor [Candidatus Limnocylindria bacterium]